MASSVSSGRSSGKPPLMKAILDDPDRTYVHQHSDDTRESEGDDYQESELDDAHLEAELGKMRKDLETAHGAEYTKAAVGKTRKKARRGIDTQRAAISDNQKAAISGNCKAAGSGDGGSSPATIGNQIRRYKV